MPGEGARERKWLQCIQVEKNYLKLSFHIFLHSIKLGQQTHQKCCFLGFNWSKTHKTGLTASLMFWGTVKHLSSTLTLFATVTTIHSCFHCPKLYPFNYSTPATTPSFPQALPPEPDYSVGNCKINPYLSFILISLAKAYSLRLRYSSFIHLVAWVKRFSFQRWIAFHYLHIVFFVCTSQWRLELFPSLGNC